MLFVFSMFPFNLLAGISLEISYDGYFTFLLVHYELL